MKMKDKNCIDGLLNFLDASPTAWHAADNCTTRLAEQGFIALDEKEAWDIKPGRAYFVMRNSSSVCAFIIPNKKPSSIRLAASHTDSPALKLKPNEEFYKENMLMLGLEIYGAPMLNSWVNRDLGIGGRLIYKNAAGKLIEKLVKTDAFPVVIPQIAIHLDRTVNENGLILNKQEHLAALASIRKDHDKEKNTNKKKAKEETFLDRVFKDVVGNGKVLASELFVFPLESARRFGENQELISSYRLDNLASVHATLEGILDAAKPHDHTIKMAAFWDNEEVGSNTAQGAGSPFIAHVIERIMIALKLNREDYLRIIPHSLCASIDLSHSVHPNYADKHEPRHPVLLNEGIVIKTNAQQRYATNAISSAAIVDICHEHEIPFQHHIARGDISCGSTVGPVHATLMGMQTIDIGIPQLSMHSSREIIGTADHLSMCRFLKYFFT